MRSARRMRRVRIWFLGEKPDDIAEGEYRVKRTRLRVCRFAARTPDMHGSVAQAGKRAHHKKAGTLHRVTLRLLGVSLGSDLVSSGAATSFSLSRPVPTAMRRRLGRRNCGQSKYRDRQYRCFRLVWRERCQPIERLVLLRSIWAAGSPFRSVSCLFSG